jgi:hypothetical protein
MRATFARTKGARHLFAAYEFRFIGRARCDTCRRPALHKLIHTLIAHIRVNVPQYPQVYACPLSDGQPSQWPRRIRLGGPAARCPSPRFLGRLALEPTPERWHLADYVLHRTFCPLDQVRTHLDHIRTAFGGQTLIHIAAHRNSIMPQLCFVTGNPGVPISDLNRAIRNSKSSDGLGEVSAGILRADVSRRRRALTGSETAPLIAGLLAVCRRQSNSQNVIQFIEGFIWHACTLMTVDESHRGEASTEIQSIILLDSDIPRLSLDINASLLDDLLLRLQATAVASSLRDSLVMAMVTDKLPGPLLQAPGNLDAALDLAVSATRSDGGAIYLMQSAKEVAYRIVAIQSTDEFVFQQEVPRNYDNALSWSVEHHTTYQISPQLDSVALPGVIKQFKGIELITPIAGPLAGTSAPAIGALALCRAAPAGEYDAYDQAITRNVALRIALMHTTMLSGRLAKAIGDLDNRTIGETAINRIGRAHYASWLIPDDYRDVLDRIHPQLAQACEATYSQSVTLRLALPDYRSTSPHALTLVRCAAHPRIRIRDRYRVLREPDGGIAWAVMRSGTYEHSRDVTLDKRYLAARTGISSELCMPVKVHGITIGTLNFESPIRDNYAATVPSVLAFAGAVGRAFEQASSARTRQVIDQAALSIAKRHAIDKQVTAFQRALRAEVLTPEGHRALEQFTTSTRQTIAEMRGKAVIRAANAGALRDIIHSTLHRLDTTLTLPEIPLGGPFDSHLDPLRATAVMVALTNLFENAISHVDPDPRVKGRPQRTVRFDRTYLDGAECAVVAVENQIRHPLPTDRLKGLYHYPLAGKSDELRLGAFLAGLAAQRAGGRLHAYQSVSGQILTSVLLIPDR